jgi:hypothetical protein
MTIVLGTVSGMSGSSPAPHAVGDHWEIYGTLTFTGNYTTGGDAFDPTTILSQVGTGTIDKVDLDDIAGYRLTFDYVNKKVQVWSVQSATTSPLVEIAGAPTAYPAALLTAATARVRITGR